MAQKRGWKWKRRKWRYFYYNDKLHKTLTVHRGQDECWAWCYKDHKKYIYAWSDIQRRGQPAITLREAAAIINRAPQTIYNWINEGRFKPPEQTYSLSSGKRGHYKFSRDHVKELHEVIKTTHRGRPRNDGMVTQKDVPNDREVRAAATHGIFIYIKSDDGNYIPVWESEEF